MATILLSKACWRAKQADQKKKSRPPQVYTVYQAVYAWMTGSLSLYVPGKKMVWLDIPVCEPPTRLRAGWIELGSAERHG
jgi:hypothetical protein